ncbi:MAG: MFS transporter, partial [Hyphomicrobiales bacterium]|nr:MFS transporter [Hyphomicrobiales bacterium]
LAMAVFGAGGPIVSTGAPKVVAQWFKGKERGLAMGIYITGPAIGSITALSLTNSVLMPLVGNDWRTVQWIWTAYALAAGVVWLMLTTRLAIGNGAAGSRAGEPQGYWSVVRDLLGIRTVRLIMIMSVGIFVINHGLNNWLPEILRAKNMSAAQAGYWAALPTIVGLAGSLLIPRLATPQRRGFILMGLCVAALVATLLLQADPGGLLIGGLILQGIARSSLTTVAILTLVETPQIGETRAATASGMFFSAAEVGGASGPLMVGVMHATTGSFQPALGFLTGVAGLLLIGAYQLHAARRTPANV